MIVEQPQVGAWQRGFQSRLSLAKETGGLRIFLSLVFIILTKVRTEVLRINNSIFLTVIHHSFRLAS